MFLFFLHRIAAQYKLWLLALVMPFLFLLSACSSSTSYTVPAFYYWKNASSFLSNEEWRSLDSAKARVLYVKFFEVGPDPLYAAVPSAKTSLMINDKVRINRLDSIAGGALEIIPCVFVLNSTLKSIRASYVDTLADNIVFLVRKYYRDNYTMPDSLLQEIQIDCDWTEGTREMYFKLLTAIKEKSNLKLSCTLRLYPYAYPKKMGVPPVDRVTLMCYNLLKVREEKKRNSILDLQELEKYLDEAEDYSLPMDLALPLFSWAQIYQQGRLVDLVDVSEELRSKLIHKNGFWYELTEDYEDYSLYLRKGEKVKIEEVTYDELQKLSILVQKHVRLKKGARVALFHLDDNTLRQYSNEQISAIYSSFNK